MKKIRNKGEILKWIYIFKRLPISRLIGLTGISFNYIKKYLEELESEGEVLREEETNATYWKIKNKEDSV